MLTIKDYLMLLLAIIMLVVIGCAPSAKSPPHNSQALALFYKMLFMTPATHQNLAAYECAQQGISDCEIPAATGAPSQAVRIVVVQNPEGEMFMAEVPMEAADYSSQAPENSAEPATYAIDNAEADKPRTEIDNSSQSLLKDLQAKIGIKISSANVPNNCLAGIDDQQQRRERLHYLIDNAPDDGCIEVLLRQLRQQ